MTFEEFEAGAWRTFAQADEGPREQLLCVALGLAGEVGEVLAAAKEGATGAARLREELGDVCYYLALACGILGTSLRALAFAEREAWDASPFPSTPVEAAFRLVPTVLSFAEHVKKTCFQVHDPSVRAMTSLLWHLFGDLSFVADLLDCTFADIMEINHCKLQARYPEGFSVAQSHHREEEDEA